MDGIRMIGRRAATSPRRARPQSGATETPRERRAPGRAHAIALTFSLFLAAFGWKLYDLQIERYAEFATQSESNYQRDEIVRALRGEVRTRDGMLLAANRMAVDLIYKGGPVRGWDNIRYLAGIPQAALPRLARGGEVTLARNVPEDKLTALREYAVLQPSLELRERLERVYPHGPFLAHLLGYTGEANKAEVDGGHSVLGDLVGRSGLEASLENDLRGKNGVRRVEVTADGRPQRDRVVDPGQKGRDVVLTIDSTLQVAAEKALREAIVDLNKGRKRYGLPPEKVVKGAIIALDPRTGEVLAFASSPTFDPNWFSQSPRPPQLVAALKGEGGGALTNRLVRPFDSGSVFKPTSTNAILEHYGDPLYNCTTAYRFSGRLWRNWAHRGYGMLDGRGAIAQSCNTWYYQAAANAPSRTEFSNNLASRARQLGFGAPTGLELLGESSGNVPSAAEFEKRGQTWWPGFSLNYAIGQGELLVTPAQVALALSTIVNEGKKRPLTMVRAVGGEKEAPKPFVQVPGDPKNFKLVKEGMMWTTQKGGTSSPYLRPNRFPVATGGKTGTAQNAVSNTKGIGYTNSWYEGYGPLDNPNFLVVSFFENGGEGYDVALPAAVKMFGARWCVPLNEDARVEGRASEIKPCTGELSEMHARIDADKQAAQLAKGSNKLGADKTGN